LFVDAAIESSLFKRCSINEKVSVVGLSRYGGGGVVVGVIVIVVVMIGNRLE
jgi:hypothetical protein